jgi:hypothetical protein
VMAVVAAFDGVLLDIGDPAYICSHALPVLAPLLYLRTLNGLVLGTIWLVGLLVTGVMAQIKGRCYAMLINGSLCLHITHRPPARSLRRWRGGSSRCLHGRSRRGGPRWAVAAVAARRRRRRRQRRRRRRPCGGVPPLALSLMPPPWPSTSCPRALRVAVAGLVAWVQPHRWVGGVVCRVVLGGGVDTGERNRLNWCDHDEHPHTPHHTTPHPGWGTGRLPAPRLGGSIGRSKRTGGNQQQQQQQQQQQRWWQRLVVAAAGAPRLGPVAGRAGATIGLVGVGVGVGGARSLWSEPVQQPGELGREGGSW